MLEAGREETGRRIVCTVFLVWAELGSNRCVTAAWLCDLGQTSEPL